MRPEGCGGVSQRRWVGSREARQGEGAGGKKPEVGKLAPCGPTGGSVDTGVCAQRKSKLGWGCQQGHRMMAGLGPNAKDLDLVLWAMESFGRALSCVMKIAAACQALC